ncbi:hypothetical protein ABZ883_04495 [Streptomyces sp. NPDC046977]|uniref:hypothetical protein n=1 Tax=Streptomyces sp. NPDC046977 TaxID=3154703 RepID=UPI0033DCFC07
MRVYVLRVPGSELPDGVPLTFTDEGDDVVIRIDELEISDEDAALLAEALTDLAQGWDKPPPEEVGTWVRVTVHVYRVDLPKGVEVFLEDDETPSSHWYFDKGIYSRRVTQAIYDELVKRSMTWRRRSTRDLPPCVGANG